MAGSRKRSGKADRADSGFGQSPDLFLFYDVDKAVEWMNHRHAVVREKGKTIVISDTFDPLLKRRHIERSSFEDIQKFYRNRAVIIREDENGKKEVKSLGDIWLSNRGRRQYDGIVFAPGQEVPGKYNLWKGFAVVPTPGDWSLFKEHIRVVICHGDASVFAWVMGWLAAAAQQPGEPAEVALVLRGARGTGKGIFARIFGALFAPHFVHINSPRQLVGSFNAHLRDAIVVFADEVFLGDRSEGIGVLKTMITEPTIPIEAKYRDIVEAKNVIHLIITSNDEWVVPAGLDERRFCVLDVSDEHAQDQAYFAPILEQMDGGGRAAMLYDLQHHDYSAINLRQPPATAALLEQKLHSLRPHERWWFDKLERGYVLPTDYNSWTTVVHRDELHADYVSTLNGLGSRDGRSTQTELGKKLKQLLPTGYPRSLQRADNQRRARFYEFPPLNECRRHFAKLMAYDEYPWPPDDPEHPATKAEGVERSTQPRWPQASKVVRGVPRVNGAATQPAQPAQPSQPPGKARKVRVDEIER